MLWSYWSALGRLNPQLDYNRSALAKGYLLNFHHPSGPICRFGGTEFMASFFFLTLISSELLGLLPGIDNYAHVGGLIEGVFAGLVLMPSLAGTIYIYIYIYVK